MGGESACKDAVIQAEGVSKVYRASWLSGSAGVWGLRGASIRATAGQIVGLVGPNGAGKTTLMALIAGVISPTEGWVKVLGHPARSVEARRCLGYMPETPAILGTYSGGAVLRYHGALLGMSRAAIRDDAERLLRQLDLEAAANRPSYGYSQGMRQRLSLAMALMGSPKVLILDEPSNGLDPSGVVKLRELLKDLALAGTTIVISSHRLGELEKMTGDYVFLWRGEVVDAGEGAAAGSVSRLRIGLVSGGEGAAECLARRLRVIEHSDRRLTIALDGGESVVPSVVRELVQHGYELTEVAVEKEDIEDVFLRLYGGRG